MPAAKRGKKPAEADQHKYRKMLRLDPELHGLLRQLAEEQYRTITQEGRLAIREHLRRAGKLPTPDKDSDESDV